ncbi:MAG TPA: GNAT family N-acetyltransferase [Coleofasciculaceae cyanobacterium]|jgi:ribosomal protein S18 acetylase RimI-like enzyme
MIQAMALESEGRQLDHATLIAGIRAVFEKPALGTYWLMLDAEKPIGCTLITVEWSDWHNSAYWWIQSLFIHPDYRGRDWFQRLMNHLELEAKQQGVCEIRLYVERNNARAIRAYDKAGFETERYLCMTKTL